MWGNPEPTKTGMAILLGGYRRLASARLLLATASGVTHTVKLPTFRLGYVIVKGKLLRFPRGVAALAVGRRNAYVYSGEPLAIVPLARGPAAYHTLSGVLVPSDVSSDGGLVLLPAAGSGSPASTAFPSSTPTAGNKSV